MQLDRKTLERLLSLSDAQLKTVLEKLSAEYGLDLSVFHVRPGDMESLRRAVRNATDNDLMTLAEQLTNGRRKG